MKKGVLKHGKRMLFLLMFLSALGFACAGEAGVTLRSRSAGSEDIVTSGDYVTLGTLGATPLLWETVELKNPDDPTTQQLWLSSSHVKESKPFDDGSNVWANSEVKSWLNGDFKNDSGLGVYFGTLLKT